MADVLNDIWVSLNWLPQTLASLLLVALAIGISRWQQVDLEKDMIVAIIRAFVQLLAIGFALDFIFASNNLFWIALVIVIMITVAGYTAGQRGKDIPNSRLIATGAIGLGAILTIVLLLVLQVFPFEPRFIIPIAGMIIGNAMTTTGLTIVRLRDDLKTFRLQIEAALALGATQQQAARQQMRRALSTGMAPIIDNTKTVGLISLPGTMTGLILGGASPLEAVQVQTIVMYVLVGTAAFSSLIATFLTYRQFFTPAHQLIFLED